MNTTNVVGFCSVCGIMRQDTSEGVPITDCVCTALKRHTEKCGYVLSVRCPIDVGIGCDKHGFTECEECDCDCGAVKK